MNIVWSPTARARAIQAMEFMERERPLAALEWLEGLVRRVGLLAELPEQGRVVAEAADPTVRQIVYRPYRVIYTIRSDHVEILTLRHFRESDQE